MKTLGELLAVAMACVAASACVSTAESAPSSLAMPGEVTIVLPTRSGATEPVIYALVGGAPASVILLPGGNGRLQDVRANFLMRVRGQFVRQGLSVAVPDVPSDHGSGMDRAFRASARHAEDLDAVIQFLRARSPGPIWLVGTSNGSVSAANAAARLGPSRIAGVVLTSTVWKNGLPLQDIEVPTLVVHNRQDGCRDSPYSGAPKSIELLAKAPAKELITIQSGETQGDPCGAMSPHGFLGIENLVVPQMIQWIKSHSRT